MNSREALVGRENELNQVLNHLTDHDDGMILLTAPFGTGKSTLLRAIREAMAERDWLLVPAEREAVIIGPEITVGSAQARVDEEWRAAIRRRTADQGFDGQPTGATVESAVSSLLAGSDLHPLPPGAVGGSRYRGRVLLTVEAQAPAPQVRDWLTGATLRSGRKETPAALIVTSDQLDDVGLERAATLVVRLGPLEVSAVRDRLDRVGPGLPAAEIAAYADAISHDPSLLDSFLRLLPLVCLDTARE